MAQEFVVLLCSDCLIYQVQQSKKATKWLCKVCNHKQSVKEFFGRGFAKHCREIVQNLNAININNSNSINDPNIQDIDLRILDSLRTTDKKNSCSDFDSNDDVPVIKKVKLTKDENSCVRDMGFAKANRLVKKKVNKWDQFL